LATILQEAADFLQIG